MWPGINSTRYMWVFTREIAILRKAAFEQLAVRLWFIHSVHFRRALSNTFPENIFEKNVDHGSGLNMTLVWKLLFVS